MLKRGVPAALVAAVMAEYVDLRAEMAVSGVGSTEPFPFQKGGRQGGVETPSLFNIILDYMLEPLVDTWSVQGY
eukprot:6478738-Karenia_brevis.AAC.1